MNRELEKGFGTIELVILTAILIGLALIFKNFIVEYASGLIDSIKQVKINIENLGN